MLSKTAMPLKNRAFKYALSLQKNLGKIQPVQLQEAINTYLGPVK